MGLLHAEGGAAHADALSDHPPKLSKHKKTPQNAGFSYKLLFPP